MKRPAIVKRIKEAIKQVAPDAQAILCGSEACGDARPESDIDLLILLEGDKDRVYFEDRHRITDSLYDIELETGVLINTMVTLRKLWENRTIKSPFYINVMNEGVIL